ncbi:Radical SAM superfamily enzyme YgiQ, UPF0313 family [Sporobacter termitidis DSM 10068]|uniref:Radical SAM superfamily enzyme YgiQ, UPF0313 family n=1 Tax=Sporobacter termitidis DSM 10068 TaxID=1123282 RepID=A0A1M5Z688_9FIRM|nr:radical SAM protein [Sporobacter termitidis]SHI19762.1 Radical SAM superfamily enzyme YgiQ, UPF0313 family [Sporobacter termitidis DSM 10068]
MDMTGEKGAVMLVAFYNTKALGVRYLETALERQGYTVITVFYKDFNSLHPSRTTEAEIALLCGEITRAKPMLIGLSVMSSMYLETVDAVIGAITAQFSIPTVCGGAFASMFPERFLERGIDFVIRADGEHAICRLADALSRGDDYSGIPSLCYRSHNMNVINDVGDVSENIDDYGMPAIVSKNACFIEHDRRAEGDPQLHALSYELIASRGCPFTCSYCCCVNLKRLLPRCIPGVRTRSVNSVIEELAEVKSKLNRVTLIHFYDEVFPNSPGWVEQFVIAYKKRVNLPFVIWAHPKTVDADTLKKLVSAGLTEVVMGVQSGAMQIRKDIFHRYETQEDIIGAVQKIRDAGVASAIYDFMLQHPFETIETLKETYALIEKFSAPFELQLHGLNFLPGTDIVPLTIERGILSTEEMDTIMYAPMQEQFSAYWRGDNGPEGRLWYKLIYCLQFAGLRSRLTAYAGDPVKYESQINSTYTLATRLFRLRHLYKKGRTVVKSKIALLT